MKRKLSYPQHSHDTFTTNPKCGSQKVLQNVIIGFVSSEQKIIYGFKLEPITTYHLWFILKKCYGHNISHCECVLNNWCELMRKNIFF